MIGGCADGFAMVRDGHYAYSNDAWAALLGRTHEELQGRCLWDDLHPDFKERLETWLAASGTASVEFSFIRADGSIAIFHLSPIRAEDGSTGFIARDLTQVKRYQARQLMADRMMSVGALAASVAHEINNPLSYVLGNLTYLSEECDSLMQAVDEVSRKDLREALAEALEGADRVRNIVADLQSFARADREKLQPIDVNETMATAISMSWIEIRHRARLVKSLGVVSPVLANEATLGQVFLNLLLNAAHALPVGHATDNEIRVESREEGDSVVVEISDTGPGIDPDVVLHVFDAFFVDTPPGIGSGLALSIAHTIVTDLGGSIHVKSDGSTGTVFKVVLPIHRPELVRDEEEDLPRGRDPGKKRILVIDDEPLLVASIRRALRDHEVHTVTSGKEAVRVLTQDPDFDIIFCDLFMAELSGMDVFSWIKDRYPGLENDIVFMTGGIYSEDAQRFLDNVKNRRIEKPFALDSLRRFVAQYPRRG